MLAILEGKSWKGNVMGKSDAADMGRLKDYLQSICDRIDALDATSIGDLPAALDNMACEAGRARRLCDSLIPRTA